MGREILGASSDFEEGMMKGVTVGGKNLVVARVEGKIYAMDGRCSHMGFDLAKGRMEGYTVTCRLHGATFDIRTGERIRNPSARSMASYPVTEEDGKVLVDLP
jgi:3-phenylpropionate/trans-cinnamate dioxygenase ferredoxin subunit